MQWVDADPAPKVTGLESLSGKVNYFRGNDPEQWRTGIPTYARVKYEKVYPGIDLVYYGNQRQLQYDFVVAPGADPKAIRLAFQGAEKLEVDNQGELVLQTPGGEVRFNKPFIYQEVDGIRQEIAGGYMLQEQQVGFQIASYDPERPLIIDPVLSYSTYLGGNGTEESTSIAVDLEGNAYVVGRTNSLDFPTLNAVQPACSGTNDAFVAKLNADGSSLIYATYLGGSGQEIGNDIAVDTHGNAYVIGNTFSADFPILNALQASCFVFSDGSCRDPFVTKLGPDGAIIYSTYLGGSAPNEQGNGIATKIIDCAADLSDRISVIRGGYRKNRATGRYLQQVTLTNPDTAPIEGPVSLVLDNLSPQCHAL